MPASPPPGPLPPVPELTDHVGYWLRLVSNAVSQAFAARVAARGVTVAEWVTLRALYGREPTPPSAVAAELAMTRGAITKLADRLIAKGLVARRASDHDGRAQTLALTPAGAALVPDLAALADTNDADFFGDLGAGDRATLTALLKAIAARRGVAATPID